MCGCSFVLCDYSVWSDMTAHTSNTTPQVCIGYICYDRGYGIDPLTCMEFRQPVNLRHMLCESAHSAYSIKPEGHNLPQLYQKDVTTLTVNLYMIAWVTQ